MKTVKVRNIPYNTVSGNSVMTVAEGYGWYASVRLKQVPADDCISGNEFLKMISNTERKLGTGDRDGRCDFRYAEGHEGDPLHKWYMVGYEMFSRQSDQSDYIIFYYAPFYPDSYPDPTARMADSGNGIGDFVVNSDYPEIDAMIVADIGKAPGSGTKIRYEYPDVLQ
jgi:hypothetical protein